jgi:hypothetical protein
MQGVFFGLDFDAFVLAAVDGLLFLVPKHSSSLAAAPASDHAATAGPTCWGIFPENAAPFWGAPRNLFRRFNLAESAAVPPVSGTAEFTRHRVLLVASSCECTGIIR